MSINVGRGILLPAPDQDNMPNCLYNGLYLPEFRRNDSFDYTHQGETAPRGAEIGGLPLIKAGGKQLYPA